MHFLGPLYKHELTVFPLWRGNYIYCNMWDDIIYPFPNFNDATDEVGEGILRYFILQFYCAYGYLSMLGLKLTHVSEKGPICSDNQTGSVIHHSSWPTVAARCRYGRFPACLISLADRVKPRTFFAIQLFLANMELRCVVYTRGFI